MAEDSMRCGARLVSIEMEADRVLALCGTPSYQDVRLQLDPALGLPNEVWYYDRGPNQLVRQLSFRDGRLEKIQTDGYGYAPGVTAGRCEPRRLTDGISKYHLLHACGEPVSKRVENQLSPYAYNSSGAYNPPGIYNRNGWGDRRGTVLAAVYREVWVYNFGSRYFMEEVTLANGVIARVETLGRRGYDH